MGKLSITHRFLTALFFLALLSLSLCSLAQEPNPQQNTPSTLDITNQSRNKVLRLFSKPGRYLFFPLVVKSPEYRWGAGLGGIVYFRLTKDTLTRTSSVKVVSFVTLRHLSLIHISE